MEDLNITLIQCDLAWEDREANLTLMDELIASVKGPTDLVLLPETFSTGFSINPATVAEPAGGPAASWMQAKAREKQCAISGTIITGDHGKYYNRLLFCFPDGTSKHYDKRHLFRLSEEYRIFTAGKKKTHVTLKGWRILPLVCYDLRFPVWSKNTWEDGRYGYDLLLYLSNWPDSRSHVWQTLLAARAIENQAYVAGVNRIGNDGFNTWHSGQSMVADPKGNIIFRADDGKTVVQTLQLSAGDLVFHRESFTVGMDWDRFTIE